MKKRFLTLALILAMCLSLAIPAFAAASGDPKPEDTAPVATESAKPEESKTPDASESAKPEESKAPDASESAKPEDKDPEPSESVKPAAPEFTDVPAGIYFEKPVAWAVEKSVTNGTSLTKFSPDETCSQVQILTFLYRAAREDGKAASAEDMDLAVAWAKEKKIIDDSFQADKPCTRSTAVSYIWQAFDKPEAEKKAEFTDVAADADYADAVNWAVEKKVTNGDGSDTIFSPGKTCTRGQIVTFLYRAYNPETTEPAGPDESAEPTTSPEPAESASPAPSTSPEPTESASPAPSTSPEPTESASPAPSATPTPKEK